MSILTDARPALKKLDKQVTSNRVTIINNLEAKVRTLKNKWSVILATVNALKELPPNIVKIDRGARGNAVLVFNTDIPAPEDDGHSTFRTYKIQSTEQTVVIEEHAGTLCCIDQVAFDSTIIDEYEKEIAGLRNDYATVKLWTVVHLSNKIYASIAALDHIQDLLGPVEDAVADALKTITATVDNLCAISSENVVK